MTATVAIVGRPNVGKSTLFNRLAGRKLALVDDSPGVTRDRREGDARLGGLHFRIIDTAGLDEAAAGSLAARMSAQTERGIAGADVCDQCEQPLVDLTLRSPTTPFERRLMKDRVSLISTAHPLTVEPTTPVADVLQLMVDKSIGCVLVAEDDQVVGIFSERDALMRLNTSAAELGDRPIAEYMQPKVEALQTTAKIAFAVQRMDQGGYRHLPIVAQDGELTGVISVRDILRYLIEP